MARRKYNDADIRRVQDMAAAGASLREIARVTNIDRTTIARMVKGTY